MRKVLELGKPVQTADKNEWNFLFVPALKLGTGHHPHTINKSDFLSETERSISLGWVENICAKPEFFSVSANSRKDPENLFARHYWGLIPTIHFFFFFFLCLSAPYFRRETKFPIVLKTFPI